MPTSLSLASQPRGYGSPSIYMGTGGFYNYSPEQGQSAWLEAQARSKRLRESALSEAEYNTEMARMEALLKKYQSYGTTDIAGLMQGLGLGQESRQRSTAGQTQAGTMPSTPIKPVQVGAAPTGAAPQLKWDEDIGKTVQSVLSFLPQRPGMAARPAYDPTAYYSDIKGAMPEADVGALRENLYQPQRTEIERARDEALRSVSGGLMARGMGGGETYMRETGRVSNMAAGQLRTAMQTSAAQAEEMGLNYATTQMAMALGASKEESDRALADVLNKRGLDMDAWSAMVNVTATTADAALRRNYEATLKNIDLEASQRLANQQAELQTMGMQTGANLQGQQLTANQTNLQAQLNNAYQIAAMQGYTQREIAYVQAIIEIMMAQGQL